MTLQICVFLKIDFEISFQHIKKYPRVIIHTYKNGAVELLYRRGGGGGYGTERDRRTISAVYKTKILSSSIWM